MRRMLADHLARGGRYSPPAAALGLGAPLAPEDEVPTLFRWPGPHALSAALRGMPVALSPGDFLWLHADPAFTPGGRAFGVLALPDAIGLHLVKTPDGSWVGAGSAPSVWVPPSAFAVPFDTLADVDAVRAAIPGYDAALSQTIDDLGAYLEELSALEIAGVPSPSGPWCAVAESDRRATLTAAGVRGRWTR